MTTPPDAKARSHGRLKIALSPHPRDLMEEPRELTGTWKAKVITLFPEAFPGTLGLSLTGKALEFGLWALQTLDLRSFGEGRHRTVDDTPAGGGAGMVLRADVADRRRVLVELTPRGRRLFAKVAPLIRDTYGAIAAQLDPALLETLNTAVHALNRQIEASFGDNAPGMEE